MPAAPSECAIRDFKATNETEAACESERKQDAVAVDGDDDVGALDDDVQQRDAGGEAPAAPHDVPLPPEESKPAIAATTTPSYFEQAKNVLACIGGLTVTYGLVSLGVLLVRSRRNSMLISIYVDEF